MEREHLIIIALILVALYMMNTDKKQDKVKAIGPAGRIRYEGEQLFNGPSPLGYIRTREGYVIEGAEGEMPQRIRMGDKDYGQGTYVKSHIRHNSRNNMFSGMMGTGCKEGFRMEDPCGPNSMPPC